MSYYDWKNNTQTCKKCGWSGPGRDAALGDTFEAGAEYHCPKCNEYFGYRAYPTIEETLVDQRADPVDRKIAAMVKRKLDEDKGER